MHLKLCSLYSCSKYLLIFLLCKGSTVNISFHKNEINQRKGVDMFLTSLSEDILITKYRERNQVYNELHALLNVVTNRYSLVFTQILDIVSKKCVKM